MGRDDIVPRGSSAAAGHGSETGRCRNGCSGEPTTDDVTRILGRIEHGETQAAEDLLPLVYDELRRLAARELALEKPGQTLQATALVHEAYLRLVDTDTDSARGWNSRGHFFAAAALAMRRILIERARSKRRQKWGGDWRRVDLDNLDLVASVTSDQLLAVDEAIERLAEDDATAASLVRLRYYAGVALEQAAEMLAISTATAYRHWAHARAWLLCALLDRHE
jgi:RNA polymerase sigma factor (TIGR02999 family)